MVCDCLVSCSHDTANSDSNTEVQHQVQQTRPHFNIPATPCQTDVDLLVFSVAGTHGIAATPSRILLHLGADPHLACRAEQHWHYPARPQPSLPCVHMHIEFAARGSITLSIWRSYSTNLGQRLVLARHWPQSRGTAQWGANASSLACPVSPLSHCRCVFIRLVCSRSPRFLPLSLPFVNLVEKEEGEEPEKKKEKVRKRDKTTKSTRTRLARIPGDRTAAVTPCTTVCSLDPNHHTVVRRQLFLTITVQNPPPSNPLSHLAGLHITAKAPRLASSAVSPLLSRS